MPIQKYSVSVDCARLQPKQKIETNAANMVCRMFLLTIDSGKTLIGTHESPAMISRRHKIFRRLRTTRRAAERNVLIPCNSKL